MAVKPLEAKLSEVRPGLFQWTDTCNVFVLRDGDSAVVIDLGNGSVLEELATIGVRRIDWVLFTHHHREQCQGAAQLAAWRSAALKSPLRPSSGRSSKNRRRFAACARHWAIRSRCMAPALSGPRSSRSRSIAPSPKWTIWSGAGTNSGASRPAAIRPVIPPIC